MRSIPNNFAASWASLSEFTLSLDGIKSKKSPSPVINILALPGLNLNDFPDVNLDITLDITPGFGATAGAAVILLDTTLGAVEVVLLGFIDLPDIPLDVTLDLIPGFTPDIPPGFPSGLNPGLGAGTAGEGGAGGAGVLLNKLDAFEVYSLTFSLNGTLLKYSLALVPKFLNIEGFGALVVAFGELAALSLAALY